MTILASIFAFCPVALVALVWQERRYHRPAFDPQWADDYRRFDSLIQQEERLDQLENMR